MDAGFDEPHDLASATAQNETAAQPQIEFLCAKDERSGAAQAILGRFDGRDSRWLNAHQIGDRRTQLLVSMHERLHHELQWSTVWGVIAAMAGLLADEGIDQPRFRQIATFLNQNARRTHEVFATTVGIGIVGVPEGRQLLAGNTTYLRHLDDGLRLGGAPEAWPWQFRESAIQMLLRSLMQPAQLAVVAERGLDRLRLRDLASLPSSPDAMLVEVEPVAGTWWDETLSRLAREHPDRGGDTGGRWERVLPDTSEEMDELKSWEETVLIPALQAAATQQLTRLGISVLPADEYFDVVDELVASFRSLAPDDWEIDVLRRQRGLASEPLGAERETIVLRDEPLTLVHVDADGLDERFLHLEPHPHAFAFYATPAVLRRQFPTSPWLPQHGHPLLCVLGRVVDDEQPIAVLQRAVTPQQLEAMFTALPVTLATTLSTTSDPTSRDLVLDATRCVVIVDLPLRLQIEAWLQITDTIRFRVVQLASPAPLGLTIFHLDGLENLWFLNLRSEEGFAEIAQLIERHEPHLVQDLDPPNDVQADITNVVRWILATWSEISEMPDDRR